MQTKVTLVATKGAIYICMMDRLLPILFLLFSNELLAQVQAMTQDRQGTIWIASDNRILRISDPPKVDASGNIPLHEPVNVLIADQNGTIWAGNKRGLMRCEKKECRKDPRITSGVRALAIDGRGQFWIGTRSGLLKLEKDSAVSSSIHSNIVDALAVDQDGSLWIGSGFEVIRWKEGKVQTFHLPPPPANVRMGPPITSILPAKSGKLYVGTHQGLLLLSNGRFQKLNDVEVLALLELRQGNIWVGTFDGLKQMENGKLIDIPLPEQE